MRLLLGKIIKSFGIILVLLIVGAIFVGGYPYIFSRKVVGEVTGVKHLLENMAVVTSSESAVPPSQKIFSFAVGVKDRKTGLIYTGSSEDRQWGVVKDGQCAEAEFFPYPPWQLSKAGTYYGVRLLRLYDNCEKFEP